MLTRQLDRRTDGHIYLPPKKHFVSWGYNKEQKEGQMGQPLCFHKKFLWLTE